LRIIADTNLLVRFIIRTVADVEQNQIAVALFGKAEEIIVPTHALCELAWVMAKGYKVGRERIQAGIEFILGSEKVTVIDDEVETGLFMLAKGGDFADGIIAHSGQKMAKKGVAVFTSFDKKAVRILVEKGIVALVPEA
jgi:predicted nucleic-acid-binding protein